MSTARWRLSKHEVAKITTRERSRAFVATQEIRRRYGLPRWVQFEQADNSLPVDLDNPLSVDALAHVLKRGGQIALSEMYPSAEQLCVRSPEGSFHHEINVPFLRRPTEEKPEPANPPVVRTVVPRETRSLAPGSEWLYVKVYGGSATLDEVLTTAVPPLVNAGLASGAMARWFFIRYSDPHPHLRIRFNGVPERLSREVLPMVSGAFNPLIASGRVWQIQFDTYNREIERYGGVEGILAAEDLFHKDSEAVLEILQQLEGDQSLDDRWRAALLGIDALLSDFGQDLEAKCASMKRLRPGENIRKALGESFRGRRQELDGLFDSSSKTAAAFEFAREAFTRRSQQTKDIVSRLRSLERAGKLQGAIADLIRSYIHMHVNRMVRSSPNQHEMVLYDFLFRLYDGRLARGKRVQAGQTAVGQ